MRFVSGLIGIVGALAGLALGIKWLSDLHSEVAQKVIPKVVEGGFASPIADLAAGLEGGLEERFALLTGAVEPEAAESQP